MWPATWPVGAAYHLEITFPVPLLHPLQQQQLSSSALLWGSLAHEALEQCWMDRGQRLDKVPGKDTPDTVGPNFPGQCPVGL